LAGRAAIIGAPLSLPGSVTGRWPAVRDERIGVVSEVRQQGLIGASRQAVWELITDWRGWLSRWFDSLDEVARQRQTIASD